MSTKKSANVNYFSDSTGFKIQPKTVLIMSLVYIGIVVLLHIYSKMTTPAKVQATINQEANTAQQQKAYTEQTL